MGRRRAELLNRRSGRGRTAAGDAEEREPKDRKIQ